jgi:hypothetical protein
MLLATTAPSNLHLRVLYREGVKEPLAIGEILLADGSMVKGFVGESYAITNQRDISSFGGWRPYKQAADA